MPPLSLERDKDDSRSFSDSSPHSPSSVSGPFAPVPASRYNAYSSHHSESMLDLNDDPRASVVSSYSSYPQDDLNPDAQRDLLLGPKMRFHSPPPWEVDDDTFIQQNHSSSRPFFSTSMFSKHKDNHKPSSSTSSDSPRPSRATRPSMDSTYSQVLPKRSFETTSSKISYPRGALYALAQESLSATSLARSSRNDGNFTSSHVRSQSPSHESTPSSPQHSSSDSPVNFRFPQSSFSSHSAIHYPAPRQSYDDTSRRSSLSSEDDIHPYANPDLVISYAVDPPPQSSLRSSINHAGISRSNSTATVTESTTNSSTSRSATHSTLTADTSVASVGHKPRASTSIQRKGISSPIPVHTGSLAYDTPALSSDTFMSSMPPDVSNLPGWTQRGDPPAFALISLEQARAQHSRGPAIQPAAPRASMSTIASGGSTMPFPGRGQDIRGTASSDSSPSTGSSGSRSRARSISAGKAKNAFQSMVGTVPKLDRRDSEPAVVQHGSGKALKHKKSGLMRLLGRAHDKAEPSSPPPVPALPESHLNQELARPALRRVPVPSLSLDSDNNSSKFTSSPKRTPPLSISTQSQLPYSRQSAGPFSPTEASQTSPLEAPSRPWHEPQPQSAPPHVSEFPALQLRPVSTLFSAQFGDIVSSATSPSDTDIDTPQSASPGGMMSPISPQINERPFSSSEDPSLIIKTLQQELASARKAWQVQKWEFEGQIRELKSEIQGLQAEKQGPWCEACGRGVPSDTATQSTTNFSKSKAASVVNRSRARAGTSSRFIGTAV